MTQSYLVGQFGEECKLDTLVTWCQIKFKADRRKPVTTEEENTSCVVLSYLYHWRIVVTTQCHTQLQLKPSHNIKGSIW